MIASIVYDTPASIFLSLLLNDSLHFSIQYTLSVFPFTALKQSVMQLSLSSTIG
jgi:hypothetical protein